MKKMIALLLAALMICAMFTGCGEKGTTLKSVQKAGKLTIATSPDFPPFESLGDNNEVVGIEIDVLNLICEQLGVTLEINQMDFDSVLPGVQAGKFDVGVSGISVTEKRQKNVLFTDPYCLAAQAIVVTEGSSITCKADLEGKTVSVQTGTTAEEYCMENGYEVLAFAANNDAAAALTSGKAAAWVVDNEVGVALAEQQGLVVLDEAMTSEPYAFAFAKDSALTAQFDEALGELLADGTVAAIFEKYGVLYVAP